MTQSDDRSQDPGRRQMAFARALPMLLFTVVTFAIIALIALSNLGAWQGAAVLYDTAAQVCNGEPAQAASPYVTTPGIHPTLAFTVGDAGLVRANIELLDPAWIPAEPSQLELVLCTGEVRPALRTLCDNSTLFNEIGGEMDVTLREASSGRVLAEGTIASESIANGDCVEAFPETQIPVPERFPAEAVIAWLDPFVVR